MPGCTCRRWPTRRGSTSICTTSADLRAHALYRRSEAGREYVDKDLYDVGGVPVLMKELLDGGYLHVDCITVTGKTSGENLEERDWPDGRT